MQIKILARDNVTQTFPCSREQQISDSMVRVTLDFTAEEFSQLERLKALKSHQVKDLKELFILLTEKELEKYNRTSKLASNSDNPRQIKITLKNHPLQKAAIDASAQVASKLIFCRSIIFSR